MPTGGYQIYKQDAIHFITFAVVHWVDVFSRQLYRDIVVDSLRYCQQQKGLVIHGWCLMSNHMHLLVSANNNNLSCILRDFKRHTSKQIFLSISNNSQESRKEWMLEIFRRHGYGNSRNNEYQFWQQDNMPKECYSTDFTVQKLDYIHNNPVTAGLVERPEYYVYSSALAYRTGNEKGLLQMRFI